MDTLRIGISTSQTFGNVLTTDLIADHVTNVSDVTSRAGTQSEQDSATTSAILGGVIAAVAAIIIFVVAIANIRCRSNGNGDDQPSATEVNDTDYDRTSTRESRLQSWDRKVVLSDVNSERLWAKGLNFNLYTPPAAVKLTDQSCLSSVSGDTSRVNMSFLYHGGMSLCGYGDMTMHQFYVTEDELSQYSGDSTCTTCVTGDASTVTASTNNSGNGINVDTAMRRSGFYDNRNMATLDQPLSLTSASRSNRTTFSDTSGRYNSRSLPAFHESLFLDSTESKWDNSYRFYDLTTSKRLFFSDTDISSTASGVTHSSSLEGGDWQNLSSFRMWMLSNVDRMDVIDEDEDEGEQSAINQLILKRPADGGVQHNNDTIAYNKDGKNSDEEGTECLVEEADSSTYRTDGDESEPLLFLSCSEGGAAGPAGEEAVSIVSSSLLNTAFSESAASNYQTCREELSSFNAHPAGDSTPNLRSALNNEHIPLSVAGPASRSPPSNPAVEARSQGEGQSFHDVRHTPSPVRRNPGDPLPSFQDSSRPPGGSRYHSSHENSPVSFSSGQSYSPLQGEVKDDSRCSGTSGEVSSSCFELSYVVFHTLHDDLQVDRVGGEEQAGGDSGGGGGGGGASGDAMQAVYDCFDPPAGRVTSSVGGTLIHPTLRKSRLRSNSSYWSDSPTDQSS